MQAALMLLLVVTLKEEKIGILVSVWVLSESVSVSSDCRKLKVNV